MKLTPCKFCFDDGVPFDGYAPRSKARRELRRLIVCQVAEVRFSLALLAFRLDSRTRVTPVAPKSIRFAPPPHEQNLLVPLLPEEVKYSA